MILRQPLETESTEPITEQDNELLAKHKEYRYMSEKMTWDPHCYECKVRYRDPKAKDLVMYLHAWRYKVTSLFQVNQTTHYKIWILYIFWPQKIDFFKNLALFW